MRGKVVVGVTAVAAWFALAVPAHAAQVVTWDTSSRYVDPNGVQFNGPASRPKALRVDVALPDGYDGRRRFPVLWLLHGHGDSYDSWVDPTRGDLLDVARGLQAIVVMPEGARGWYTSWWNGGARSPGWERYHLEELIPFVESRLKILPGRRWHAIAGNSMGGEGAAYYATQRPGYFGSVALFSAPLSIQRSEWPLGFDTQGENHTQVFGDPDAQRFYWTGHNPIALVANLRQTRVYVTVGDGGPSSLEELTNYFGIVAEAELRQHADEFAAAARTAGVDVTYAPKSGIHDWPYWRNALAAAIRWDLFAPVPERPARWRYDTVAPHGAAFGLRFDFATPPQTLESFRVDGRTVTGLGAGTVRVEQDGGPPFTATLPFTRALPPHYVRKARRRRRAACPRRPARKRAACLRKRAKKKAKR
jgi:S-formylglutathione hydrolase FrmB